MCGSFDSHTTLVQLLEKRPFRDLFPKNTLITLQAGASQEPDLKPCSLRTRQAKADNKKKEKNMPQTSPITGTTQQTTELFQSRVEQDREHWHLGAEGCRAGWGPLGQRWKGGCSNGLGEVGEPSWRPTGGPSLWSCLGQTCHSSSQVF